MTISFEMDRFKKVFWEECNDLLASVEENLSSLNENIELETIHSIFRSIHTIKGAAGSFELFRVVEFAHAYETVLDHLREQKLHVNDVIMKLLFKSYDVLTDLVHAEENNKIVDEEFGLDVLEELRLITQDASIHSRILAQPNAYIGGDVHIDATLDCKEVSVFHINFQPHENLLHYGNEPILVFKQLKNLAVEQDDFHILLDADNIPDLFDLSPNNLYMSWKIDLTTCESKAEIFSAFEFVSDLCNLDIQSEATKIIDSAVIDSPVSDHAAENTQRISALNATTPLVDTLLSKTSLQTPASTSKAETLIKSDTVHTLRVEIDRIDKLVNTVGEIVIKQSMVINQAKDLDDAQYTSIVNGLHELSQYTRELQENVMAIRAQPIKSVFSRMPRLVRDLAAQLNKNVSIETHGEETEIDKTVIENLSEPLMHIIRNAIDHGIENPEERAAANKPKESKIILSAEHKNGRISIQIKDDGKGINRERVRQKAIEKGLINSDAVLVGDEVDNLILLPGFSTAENITNISGRGVGLDVVKKSVQSLGGRLHIQSQEGKGCSFNLTLPLTLAVLDGMVVSCLGKIYIVPLVSIVETLSPKNDQLVDLVGGIQLLKLRGLTVPLFFLSEAFKLTCKKDREQPRIVVVVETETGEKAGIVVDELQGKQQVVMKSLEENYEPIVGISAATIMGDGSVVPILDVNAICDLRRRKA